MPPSATSPGPPTCGSTGSPGTGSPSASHAGTLTPCARTGLTRRTSLPAAPVQEQYARLRLIELLTGTHPRYLPEPLRLPGRSQGYDEFVLAMPEQLAFCLHYQARSLLSKASISEPATWEPPFDWVTGIPWPGPDPDGISTEDLHPLIRAGLPVRAIAARLGTTADHVRLTAARYPAPRLPPGSPAPPPPEPQPPGTDQLRDLAGQGHGPRKIARITGCSERIIRQLLASAGLRPPTARSAHPQAPRTPRPARPHARGPPARHPERHPHQPGPPARGHRRHSPSAHPARRATHTDRLRRAVRPRLDARPQHAG